MPGDIVVHSLVEDMRTVKFIIMISDKSSGHTVFALQFLCHQLWPH